MNSNPAFRLGRRLSPFSAVALSAVVFGVLASLGSATQPQEKRIVVYKAFSAPGQPLAISTRVLDPSPQPAMLLSPTTGP